MKYQLIIKKGKLMKLVKEFAKKYKKLIIAWKVDLVHVSFKGKGNYEGVLFPTWADLSEKAFILEIDGESLYTLTYSENYKKYSKFIRDFLLSLVDNSEYIFGLSREDLEKMIKWVIK